MAETLPWTEQEDIILKKLRQDEKLQKWTVIAQKMAEVYNFKGRNSKQCKQRYQTLFEENIPQEQWDYDQQQKLFYLHNQLGNKWAIIGNQILNKSDNEVKNHLYSRLRKGLRKLNKLIKQNFKKQYKQIKQNLIYKIIEGAEDKFKTLPLLNSEVSEYCTQLKMKLITYSYDDTALNHLQDFQNNQQAVKNFIQELIQFTKDYKRKPKKVRRASGHDLQVIIQNNDLLTIPLDNNRIKSNNNSPWHSDISESDNEEMAQFNSSSLKPPLLMFDSNDKNKKNRQKMQNIILLRHPNLNEMGQMQQQNLWSRNGKFLNFAAETKQLQGQILWQQKGNECIWNSGKMDASCQKGAHSGQMIDEAENLDLNLKKKNLVWMKQQMLNSLTPANLKKLSISQNSSFTNFQIDNEEQLIFDEEQSPNYIPSIHFTGINGKKQSLLDSSMERNYNAFKPIEAFGMFQSVQSKHSQKLFGSIDKD